MTRASPRLAQVLSRPGPIKAGQVPSLAGFSKVLRLNAIAPTHRQRPRDGDSLRRRSDDRSSHARWCTQGHTPTLTRACAAMGLTIFSGPKKFHPFIQSRGGVDPEGLTNRQHILFRTPADSVGECLCC